MSRVTKSAAAGTQAIAQSIEELNGDIALLQARVDRFRLTAAEAAAGPEEPGGVRLPEGAVTPWPVPSRR